MTQDNIEEVKKILEAWQDTGTDYVVSYSFGGVAREIDKYYSQLFPQPSTDEELREKIAEVLRRNMGVRVADTIHGKEKEYFFPDMTGELLTLLQQRVEEAKKQERERIVNWGIEICHEHLPKWQGEIDLMGGVLSRRECHKCWQALSPDKEGK